MKFTLIYPNQLFYNHPAISKNQQIVLVEDPLFFGDTQYPLKFHKKKIVLHLASIESFKKELIDRGYSVIKYNYSDLIEKNHNIKLLKSLKATEISLARVVDYTLEKRLVKAAKYLKIKINWFETPGFFLNAEEVVENFDKKKKYLMNSFYINQRKKLNILLDDNYNPIGGKWSFDLENRKKLPKNIVIPKISQICYKKNEIEKSIKTVEDIFSSNLGTVKNFNFPISRLQAQKSFREFLEKRLHLFGVYEDAIAKENNFVFHSIITPYLNIGLITPDEIVSETLEYANQNEIPLNSLEGFIRQIIGWREFIRGIYTTEGVRQRNGNFWKFNREIPNAFYTGDTGLDPLDNTIKHCLESGYTHHIERLMILGNIMVLLGIKPESVYNWFMEIFIDSYDWVMVPNIFGMSQYADGGLMSTKPYTSGRNYILKMSNYKKGEWSETWDALYWNFINKNREFFKKNPRMSMMVSMYDRQKLDKKNRDADIVKTFINSLF